MVARSDALSNLDHGPALQVGVDKVNSQQPTWIVERHKPQPMLVLPQIIALRLIPLDDVAKIYGGLRRCLASVHGM